LKLQKAQKRNISYEIWMENRGRARDAPKIAPGI